MDSIHTRSANCRCGAPKGKIDFEVLFPDCHIANTVITHIEVDHMVYLLVHSSQPGRLACIVENVFQRQRHGEELRPSVTGEEGRGGDLIPSEVHMAFKKSGEMQNRFPAPDLHESRSPRSVVATRYPFILSNRPIEDVVMFTA